MEWSQKKFCGLVTYPKCVFCKKNGLRLVHFSLGEAVYKVPVDIGGSHSALCLVAKISKRDRVQ